MPRGQRHAGPGGPARRPNRYIVEGLPLKIYDCSQITDGYAGMVLATEEGLRRLGVARADCVESRATARRPTR